MRYRVFVSNGDDYYEFYEEYEEKAELLFDMAVKSKFFCYVELSVVEDRAFVKKEWAEEDDERTK